MLFINLPKKKILRTKDFTIQVTYPSHVTFSKIEVKINGFEPLRGLAVFLFTSCIDRYIQKNIFSFHKFHLEELTLKKKKEKHSSTAVKSLRVTFWRQLYISINIVTIIIYHYHFIASRISRISIFRIQATVSCQMQFIREK